MTKEERRLIRTCLCNGFELHSRNDEDGTATVRIGDELFDFDRLNELVIEVENALDRTEAAKPNFQETLGKVDKYRYGRCPNCGMGVNYEMKFCDNCGQALDWSGAK